ncbi:MAG: hypothetical protein AB3N21_13750 [Ruegeria sp.]|uniref:hypothetical protein n=1 Tax=Ruegeria sp. TaxID=1879320 RepID=UPI00349E8761
MTDYATMIFGETPETESEGYDYAAELLGIEDDEEQTEVAQGGVPEGFFLNPDTGQMTSREMLTEHHRQTGSQGGAVARMAPHGARWAYRTKR